MRGRFIDWVSREAYFLSHMAGMYSILSGTWVTPVLYMLRANPDQSWRACCISYLPMRQPQNQLVFQRKMANLVQNGVWKALPWVVKKKHKPAVLERLLCDEHGALSRDCRPALKETLVCGTYNTPWLKNDNNWSPEGRNFSSSAMIHKDTWSFFFFNIFCGWDKTLT